MYAIKTENLKKFYGRARGIDGINLAVCEGDFFGFIGPNGAGKSTTVRTLLGIISPTSGTAEIFGKDIIKNRNEILCDVGYMPSELLSILSKLPITDINISEPDLEEIFMHFYLEEKRK